MTQTTLHEVACDGGAHGPAHDETRTRGDGVLPGGVRAIAAVQMYDQKRATGAAPPANRTCEVLAPPQPVLSGQHEHTRGLRRTGACGPCRGGP